MEKRSFPRPRIVVSRCLGFAPCRYDGTTIGGTIVEILRDYVDVIPVCPEVAIGLGVPRPPIRIVLVGGKKHLLQESTGIDLTERMEKFALDFLLSLHDVSGFILKAKSPSCGFRDVNLHAPNGRVLTKGHGFFVEAVLKRYPHLAVETERRLENLAIREHFLQKIFATADFLGVRRSRSLGQLVDFHSRYKLFLMAHNQSETQRLGAIVAEARKRGKDTAFREYEEHFFRVLQRSMNRKLVVNVLQHVLGYFKDRLSPQEKSFFLKLLEDFRQGAVSFFAPVTLVRSWIVRFEEPYLARQVFFAPYPEELRPKVTQDLVPLRDFFGESIRDFRP
ncbi:MAG: YbgA family protein [Candidatus Caldatribacteriaceae bacterium]